MFGADFPHLYLEPTKKKHPKSFWVEPKTLLERLPLYITASPTTNCSRWKRWQPRFKAIAAPSSWEASVLWKTKFRQREKKKRSTANFLQSYPSKISVEKKNHIQYTSIPSKNSSQITMSSESSETHRPIDNWPFHSPVPATCQDREPMMSTWLPRFSTIASVGKIDVTKSRDTLDPTWDEDQNPSDQDLNLGDSACEYRTIYVTSECILVQRCNHGEWRLNKGTYKIKILIIVIIQVLSLLLWLS